MLRSRTRIFALLLIGLVTSAGLLFWHRASEARAPETAYGVTFSTLYAKELGLDWRQAYLATLDELGVRKLRLPVYWNAVEKERGVYDWSEVDWMLEEAARRNVDVILTVGRKTPRWPECHAPEWAAALSPAAQDERVLEFLAAEVAHFKNAPAVTRWQVENEPLFDFGICPSPDRELLKREIALVREADAKPILVTDSGELSTWLRTGPLADVLGISVYRIVWNGAVGQLYWPVPPTFYSDRVRLLSPFLKSVIVSELQAEPWFHKPVEEVPLNDQLLQMNPDRMRSNAGFAAASGASEIYLWGVEWWYWMAAQGRPELWEAAKTIFHPRP